MIIKKQSNINTNITNKLILIVAGSVEKQGKATSVNFIQMRSAREDTTHVFSSLSVSDTIPGGAPHGGIQVHHPTDTRVHSLNRPKNPVIYLVSHPVYVTHDYLHSSVDTTRALFHGL